MTWVLAIVMGTAFVLLLADAVLTRLAERRAARLLGDALETQARVSARSWPAAFLLLTSVGSRARVVATDVPIPDRGCDLSRLELDLCGMHLVPDDDGALYGRLEARTGRFTAELDEQALAALTPLPGLRGVEIRDEGVRYRMPGGVKVEGTVDVDDTGTLVFTPSGGPLGTLRIARIAAPIGRLPLGATVEHVETRRGEIVVSGQLEERSFDLRSASDGAPR